MTGTSDVVRSRQQHGRDQIIPSVAAQLVKRDLGAGENHWLFQVFQHERQRRGRVGHGIGPVHDDKTVVVSILLRDQRADLVPLLHGDVRGIQNRRHLLKVPFRHARMPQLGDFVERSLQIARLRRIAVLGRHHADGPAGVDDQDVLHARVSPFL